MSKKNLEYTVQGPLGSYGKALSQNISNGKNGRKEGREERRYGRKNNRGVKGKERGMFDSIGLYEIFVLYLEITL